MFALLIRVCNNEVGGSSDVKKQNKIQQKAENIFEETFWHIRIIANC